ncbi:MAG: hypothetical protein VKL42_01745 [Snowella sp.]|nr:hypothetical protein [Snowella sp.]
MQNSILRAFAPKISVDEISPDAVRIKFKKDFYAFSELPWKIVSEYPSGRYGINVVITYYVAKLEGESNPYQITQTAIAGESLSDLITEAARLSKGFIKEDGDCEVNNIRLEIIDFQALQYFICNVYSK